MQTKKRHKKPFPMVFVNNAVEGDAINEQESRYSWILYKQTLRSEKMFCRLQ